MSLHFHVVVSTYVLADSNRVLTIWPCNFDGAEALEFKLTTIGIGQRPMLAATGGYH